MAAPADARGFWRSVQQLPDRASLRVKLITAVLALVAVALMVISVAGISVLRSVLVGQANTQLSNLYAAAKQQTYGFGGAPGSVTPGPEQWVYKAIINGKVIPVSDGGTLPAGRPGPSLTGETSWLAAHANQAITVPAQSGRDRWRVVSFPANFTNRATGQQFTGTLVIGLNVTTTYDTLAKLTSIDLLVSVLILLGLAIVGVAVVRASLRPLTDIEQTAAAIAAGDLSRRVPERDPRTEIGRLGRSLNTMLAQIEVAFHARSASEIAARRSEDRMRQFVADASHELRTPLTAIRGFAEYYRQRGGVDVSGHGGPSSSPRQAGAAAEKAPEADSAAGADGAELEASAADPAGTGQLPPAELDRIMRRVEQESSRMGVLVEDMLLLARLDQQRPLERRTVDLLTLAADAVHDARVVAPDRGINLTVGAGTAPLVLGDEVRLRQVVGNLMSNAMAHTPPGTPIKVRIRSGSLDEASAPGVTRPSLPGQPPPAPQYAGARSAAVLEVTDHGPGLSREQAERAFERFYRADQARTTGGTGLGLAIVAALVAAHGGTVWVESAPGAGATFRIALPLAPEALHLDADPEDTDDTEDAEDTDDAELAVPPGTGGVAGLNDQHDTHPGDPAGPDDHGDTHFGGPAGPARHDAFSP